jgi:hypothetical protein
MNYCAIYDSLVAAARANPPQGYTEKHHIVPRCLGGGDAPENIVRLSARQHFVAHLLLAKIHGGKLIVAAFRMSVDGKHGARNYEWLQKAHAKEKHKLMIGNKYGEKLRGRKQSPQHAARRNSTPAVRAKKSEKMMGNQYGKILLGRKRDPEIARKVWAARRKNGTDRHSQESRAKMSQSHANMAGSNNPMSGRKHSVETCARMRAAKKASTYQGTRGKNGRYLPKDVSFPHGRSIAA